MKSVAFWKKVILAGIAVMILIPAISALLLGLENARLRRELEARPLPGDDAVSMGTNTFDAASIVRKRPLLSYQLLYPEFAAEFAGFTDDLTDQKEIFLTFDDGPSPTTPAILDLLRNEEIKATFFVNGKTSLTATSWLKRIASEGHTIGMHSYSHQYPIIYASVENFIEDLYKNYLYIKNATGQSPTLLRFPGGSINTYNIKFYKSLTAEMLRRGFIYCDWNVSGGDTIKNAKASDIASNVIAGVKVSWGPAFVLLHDNGNSELLQALPRIIQTLKADGYHFSALNNSIRPPMFVYPEY